MTGIFYFSSTGNSLYIARRLREKLGGEVCFIPSYRGRASEFDRVVIVSPVYGFGLPRPTYEFIASLGVSVPVYVVLNYGGAHGPSERLAWELCKNAGLDVRGVWSVKMPINFTIVVPVPEKYQRGAMKKAPAAIDTIAASIDSGETRPMPAKKDGTIGNYLKNLESIAKFSNKFSSSDDCTGCGHCQEVCPTGNVAVVAGAPVWGEMCVGCLGCFHRCPQQAILVGGKKKGHYLNPNVDEGDIGR